MDVLYEELEAAADDYSAEYYGILAEIEDCEDALIQCQVAQEEWNYQIKRLPIERLQMFRDLYSDIVEDMDNYMAQQSKMGLNPTKEELQQYIDLYSEQIDSAIKQQSQLKDLLDDYEYGSDKFNEISDEIQGLDNEISSLIQNQIEYNHQILQIPVTEMAEQVEELSAAKTALQNSISEDNANGLQTTIDQYKDLHSLTLQQIQLLVKQRSALSELLNVYDEDSEHYKEAEQQIRDIDNEMSNLVQETYQWNQEMLNIPIDKLEKVNDNLSSYSSILGDVLSDLDNGLSGVNALIDGEIEGYQEILDLLNEQNKAKSVQLALEQAQYNLERARNQKNIKVVRDGEIQYEANQDSIRSASEELANAQYDKMVYDLELQIQRLEDIKSKWAEIVEEIERANQLQQAEDIFESPTWKEDILSGNDDTLYNMFKQLYESTTAEKESVDKQIESNERISQMMNEFVTRYQEGSITYEQALSGINDMTQSMEGGYTALENLSGMMNLDNINGLENIASSTQEQINQSADLLKQYMTIVEANKQSVEGFETNWDDISETIGTTIQSFDNAVSSMDSYIEVFKNNAEAIGRNTSTWDEMKENIAAQIKALEDAAKALEEAQKKLASGSGSSNRGTSSDSDSSGGGSGIYAGGKVHSEKEGSTADIIMNNGTQAEKDRYWDYRESVINNSPQASDSGWKEAALKALEDEKNKYHSGVNKGSIGTTSISDEDLKELAKPSLKHDEYPIVAHKGERVYTSDQIFNTIDNVRNDTVEQLLPHLRVNPLTGMPSLFTSNIADYVDVGNHNVLPNVGNNNVNKTVEVNFNGGITMHEVQDVEAFTNELFHNVEPILTQKLSKIF